MFRVGPLGCRAPLAPCLGCSALGVRVLAGAVRMRIDSQALSQPFLRDHAISMRSFVARLIWLCMLPPLIVATWLAVDGVHKQQQAFMNDARHIAGYLALAIDQRLQARINGLNMLAFSPFSDDPDGWSHLYREAQDYQKSFDAHVVFALATEPMQMLFTTREPFGTPLPTLPRPQGRAAAPEAVATGKPAVGDSFRSQLGEGTLVGIAVPVLREGRAAYVMVSIIETERFQQRLDQLDLPERWALTLLDRGGTRLAERIPPGMDPRRDVDPEGRIEALSALSRWSVVLEIPRDVYHTPMYSAIAKFSAGLLAALLIGVFAGKIAARRLVGGVASLVEAPRPDVPRSDIAEIAAARDYLDAAAAQRIADSQTLLASEQRFTATFEQAAVGIALVATNGEWLRANRRLSTMLGWPPGDLVGKSFRSLTHPDDVDNDAEEVGSMLDGEIEHYAREKRFLRRDGSAVWVNLTVSLVRTAQGDPDYFVAVIEDIDARKRVQDDMLATKGKLEAALASMTDAVFITDRWGRFVEVNEAFASFHRCRTREDCPRTQTEYAKTFEISSTSGEVLPENEWPVPRALRGDARTSEELILRCKETGETWVGSFSFAPIRDGDGEIAGAVVTGRDVTEQRAAEDAVRESESKLRLALDAAKAGSWEWDIATGRNVWSDEVFRLYGLTPGSSMPSFETWIATVHPDDRDAAVTAVTAAREMAAELNVEWRVRHPDGSERWLMSRGRPDVDRRNRPWRYLGIVVDITERKRVEAELEQHRNHLENLVASRTAELAVAKAQAESANQAKSVFLANMSHEIRTPMNAIIGLTHLVLRAGQTPEQAERMRKIENAGRHLLSIINDILDISKIEAGRVELESMDFHLSAILDNIRSLIGEQARNKGLQVDIDPDSVPVWLRGDPTRLRQALLNYAGNAVKFTERGRVVLRAVLIEANADDLLVRFEVEDTGIGIPADVLPDLFRSFEQADTSTTRKYGGTGLGLAITRRLAGLMGGEAGASSTPGVGSTFWLTARLGRGHGIMPEPEYKERTDAEGRLRLRFSDAQLLLVEDNAINSEVAMELLHSVGLNADTAANGYEAIKRARDRHYHLILMDMQMPEMDGMKATRAIRALPGYETTPIIAMTANAFDEDRRVCEEAGMDDFVTKPVNPADFFTILLKWLSHVRTTTHGPHELIYRASPARRPLLKSVAEPTDTENLAAGGLPGLAGIDQTAGLGFALGKKDLYLRVLRRFRDGFGNTFEAEFAAALDSGDWAAAVRLAHTLKGLARSMGAARLGSLAEDLEKAAARRNIHELNAARPAAMTELGCVMGGLQALGDESEPPARSGGATVTEAPRTDAEECQQAIENMQGLLESRDTAAVSSLDDFLRAIARLDPAPDRLGEFRAAVLRYDYATALKLLPLLPGDRNATEEESDER